VPWQKPWLGGIVTCGCSCRRGDLLATSFLGHRKYHDHIINRLLCARCEYWVLPHFVCGSKIHNLVTGKGGRIFRKSTGLDLAIGFLKVTAIRVFQAHIYKETGLAYLPVQASTEGPVSLNCVLRFR